MTSYLTRNSSLLCCKFTHLVMCNDRVFSYNVAGLIIDQLRYSVIFICN